MRRMKGKAGHAGLTATLMRVGGTAVDLSAQDGKPLPRRMKILNWGENANARGKRVHVGDKLVRALSAPVYPFRTVALDFEHNTMRGTPAYEESSEPRKVAAFCRVEVVPGEGVFLCVENWTPDGVASAANYRDLSAGAVTDPEGEVIAVLSAALCRCGAVEGMDFKEVPVSLSADALAAITNQETEDEDVNWKQMICQALGLDPEKATDEEVAGKLKETLSAVGAAALNAAVSSAVETAVKPLQEQVAALSASGTSFAAELAKRDKTRALDLARFEGKAVALSASAVEAMSLKDLTEHLAALPVTVPLNARTPGHVPEKPADQGPGASASAIARQCGMEPEQVWPKK